MKIQCLALAVIFCCSVRAGASPTDSSSHSPLVLKYRAPTAEEQDVIRNADRVESFRVNPIMSMNYTRAGHKKDFEDFGTIGDYFITQIGPDLTKAQRKTLAKLLLNPENYLKAIQNDHKLCIFSPRHALRFHKVDRIVESLICFQCEQLHLGAGGGDFDPMATTLLGIFQEVGLIERESESR